MYAKTFLRTFRSGSSLPLLVETKDGSRFVVKAHGSGDGPTASVVDWIALSLGRALGLPMAEPRVVHFDVGFETQAEDPEVSELIARSVGANFATAFVEGQPATTEIIQSLPEKLREQLFLFDVLLLNVDRTIANPNAMVLSNTHVLCLDLASAMSLRSLLLDRPLSSSSFLEQIRRNPLYQPDVDISSFLASLDMAREALGGIVATIPEPWLAVVRNAHDARQTLTDRLDSFLLSAATLLPKWLSELNEIQVESPEARALRHAANKSAFEARFGTF